MMMLVVAVCVVLCVLVALGACDAHPDTLDDMIFVKGGASVSEWHKEGRVGA